MKPYIWSDLSEDQQQALLTRPALRDDLRVIELNGVTAEPTDIYDPNRSLTSAYAALFDQWRRVFEIGAANLRRGHRGASTLQLLQLGFTHFTASRAFPVSS